MRETVRLNLNGEDAACMGIIKLKCAPTSGSKMSKLKVDRGLGFQKVRE